MRSYPDHVFVRAGSSFLRIAPPLVGDPKLGLLADPDLLFADSQCEVIKDQRKIKVGRIDLEIGGRVRGIYSKRYNAFSWRYRLGSLFVPSGASRSWFGAGVLLRAGFHTGQPLAAVEYRSWGMLTKSFYLSGEVSRSKTADVYWREDLMPLQGAQGLLRRRQFLARLAKLFRSLHALNIYHNDLKDANILVRTDSGDPQESFYLLDLEGIRRYGYLNRRRRIKNVVQLNRTMGRFLRRTERLYWLKGYLEAVFFDREEKRKWIRKVLAESLRRDRRSLRKG